MAMADPEIVIVETTPAHIREMAEVIDAQTASVAIKLGVSPKKALWMSYRQSIICMTALIEGRVVAMWGVGGQMFSDVGRPWLTLSPEVENHPFRVAFRYRKELNRFQQMFPVLEEWVETSNVKAIRLLALMGFKIGKNEIPLGETTFFKAERRG